MSEYVSIFLIGCAFFTAVAVLLTADAKTTGRMTVFAGVTALTGGLLAYGYGYIMTSESVLQAVLRTVFAVCRMFIGEADFGDIQEVPLFSQPWAVTLFWCVHVLAFYATSSAAISLLGSNILKKLRLRFSRAKELNIVYGINSDSLSFGSMLATQSHEAVVYVPEDTDLQMTDAFRESGNIVLTDAKAIRGTERFLKSLGIRRGNRKVTLYALSKDQKKNMDYAGALLAAFEKREVTPSQISLVIHARESGIVKEMQTAHDRFGYGFVTVFQEADLMARLLVRKHPPCRSMNFNAAGAATEDFETLIIGFGKIGQTVLRRLVMSGQFEGSSFRADVFTKELSEDSGFFMQQYRGLLDHYPVFFHNHDGRSRELYAYLSQRLEKLKYVVVCTGSDKVNAEIEEQLCAFFRHEGKAIAVHQCSYTGIRTTDTATGQMTVQTIYDPDVLSTRKLDAMAMAVNHYYMGARSKGLLADWMDCDYFSRLSSRAFADSIEAVLQAAGKTRQQAMDGQWELTPEQMENLGKMEHARWCAFHFSMGFSPMSREEFAERGRAYLEEVRRSGKGSIQIRKNAERRTHACLVSWDGLDTMAKEECKFTGKTVDYKQNDKNNVMIVPELLRIRYKGISEEDE